MTRDRSDTQSAASENAPSIRFSAYYDPRSTRPSLSFPPVSRTLPNGTEVIRVGRYSERDSHAMANLPGSQPSAAPVGFKSKVVSRRHCEFWYEGGKWFIKDESKAFPVNDGDIVQLGIDFKGGEEMIFRCVKMRLELNRGWQNKPNSFNIAAHKRLRTIANGNGAAEQSSSSQDCSICLNSIAPCQSLFVAPCSHTWHFKCVRSLLTSPQYPIFICPNCRAGADLEADVEDANEEWLQYKELEEKEQESLANTSTNGNGSHADGDGGSDVAPGSDGPPPAPETAVQDPSDDPCLQESDAMDLTVNISPADSPATPQRAASSHATSEPLCIRNASARNARATPSPPGGAEGPITPRNDAGPWVFDGRGGRRPADSAGAGAGACEMRSLDATTEMDLNSSIASDDSSR
ncbi:E3 ubiquitin-protein ligase DMA1 [Escovopsis weberi]|uniref:RING-type E3 ubiquitin transferase n=1 Tax=Escovopsis weberi TaxID=150374 RepID=A0A0N0RSU3_ESCWE|nr:E3 ubiquitin-protein ligase DMA1 [Escovopsis weberi]